jgi:colanic acid/amylovoran biosynthesis glycosyltransferase
MRPTFAEISGLPVVVNEDGSFTLTQKFVDGMRAYVEQWDGPVVAVMHPQAGVTNNLDNVRVGQGECGFNIIAVPFGSKPMHDAVAKAGFVHWGPHHLNGNLVQTLADRRVANVYSTEYAFKTRIQIVNSSVSNPIRRARKYLWEYNAERRMRRETGLADGFEANGTPTFQSLGRHSKRKLLYFASWMREKDFIAQPQLERRLAEMTGGTKPLRLVFSGRLIAMKGVLDLIDLAKALRQRHVDFTLTVCGDGVLAGEMTKRIKAFDLEACVNMKGVLDFKTELVPFVKENADLFVCCHRQGDPSSTYLETAACGVPILGYGNEAFAGLAALADLGWTVPLGDVSRMTDQVATLSRDRGPIAKKSGTALAFALEHTFEKTFTRRIHFFRDVLREKQAVA